MARTIDKPRALRDGATMGQASSESALCPTAWCSSLLEFYTIPGGRVLGRCTKCGYYEDPRATKNPAVPITAPADDPMGIQEIPALPPVEPDQLRCQRCARGVKGRARFCPTHTRENRSAALRARWAKVPRPPKPERGTRRARVYKPKPCLDCGTTFTPTGPRSRFCPGCKAGE